MRTIDADVLLKTIEDHAPTVSCCPTDDWSIGKAQMKKQIIKDIRNAPTIGGWVSVKDRPPDEGQHVVVQHEVNGVHYEDVAHYFSERWWLDGMSNGVELNASRWYFFPEPPEVNEE